MPGGVARSVRTPLAGDGGVSCGEAGSAACCSPTPRLAERATTRRALGRYGRSAAMRQAGPRRPPAPYWPADPHPPSAHRRHRGDRTAGRTGARAQPAPAHPSRPARARAASWPIQRTPSSSRVGDHGGTASEAAWAAVLGLPRSLRARPRWANTASREHKVLRQRVSPSRCPDRSSRYRGRMAGDVEPNIRGLACGQTAAR